MLLTALPPAPPTPKTVIRGFSSRISGIFRLMLMVASCVRGRMHRRASPAESRPGFESHHSRWSKAFAKPSSDPSDVAARPRSELPRMPRPKVLQMSELRIDQEARRHRKSRSPGDLGQARNAQRPTETNRPPKDAGRKIT